MSDPREFFVKFWGVRGSIACPGPGTVRYGGNTPCIEIRCGDSRIIIDGGTGLRNLGTEIAREIAAGGPARINLFFTHTHFDHVAGVPFFRPAYMEKIRVDFWAGHLTPEKPLRQVLCDVMAAPLFPVPVDVFCDCQFHDFACGTPLHPAPGVEMTTCRLNHPNGACGYRIDYAGKSVCVITDTEHVAGTLDRTIVDFVRGADIMIYDAMFTDEEFPKFVSWGHSTWQEALRVADAAGVGVAVPFHHDPNHDDAFLDRLSAKAEKIRPGTVFAREGLVLRP
ncbi:MAG TPA: MBL fold metallo-hydrolase [Alphaproteobacteria bacterium]|nr:MBL fold metallo-hydrolase [Alphaproteobacteria bacterium]